MAEKECLNPGCVSKVPVGYVVCSSCYRQVLNPRQRDLIRSRDGVAVVARELGYLSKTEIQAIEDSRR